MKKLIKLSAILLSFSMLLSTTVNATETHLKQAQPKKETISEQSEENLETSEEMAEETKEEKQQKPTSSVSENEFNLECDYKTIKAENVRYILDGKFSFAHLPKGTYVKYIKHTEDTVDVETIINGNVVTVSIPTASIVLASTVIKLKNGSKQLVSELDPDYATKIKQGKIIAKAGELNPLLNTDKFKKVGALLKDAGSQTVYTPSVGKKTKKALGGVKIKSNVVDDEEDSDDENDSSSTEKMNKPTKINRHSGNIVVGVNLRDGSSPTVKSKKQGTPIQASTKAQTTIYDGRNTQANALTEVNEGETIEVYSVGVAFSYVTFGEFTGYIQTNSLQFESFEGLAVVGDKIGKIALHEEENVKSKKLKELTNGTVALVLENNQEFLKVFANGQIGYILNEKAKFVEVASDNISVETITKKNVNVRTEDSKKGFMVEKLAKETQVVVVEDLEHWYAVELSDGKFGFVEKIFLN